MRRRAALAGCLMLAATATHASCRQALALGLDVSGSVNAAEYRLQLDGLAAALQHPEVRQAFLDLPSAPVTLAVYEWSGPDDQRILLDWTAIISPETLDRITARLQATTRQEANPGTALGTAILVGGALLNAQTDCWKRTLDISGDGKSNMGPHPRDVTSGATLGNITVNALVVGADAPSIGDLRQAEIAELSSYFRAYVLRGPDAFIETALGFEQFEDAMVRKLKRELEGLAVSDNRKGPKAIRPRITAEPDPDLIWSSASITDVETQ